MGTHFLNFDLRHLMNPYSYVTVALYKKVKFFNLENTFLIINYKIVQFFILVNDFFRIVFGKI